MMPIYMVENKSLEVGYRREDFTYEKEFHLISEEPSYPSK